MPDLSDHARRKVREAWLNEFDEAAEPEAVQEFDIWRDGPPAFRS